MKRIFSQTTPPPRPGGTYRHLPAADCVAITPPAVIPAVGCTGWPITSNNYGALPTTYPPDVETAPDGYGYDSWFYSNPFSAPDPTFVNMWGLLGAHQSTVLPDGCYCSGQGLAQAGLTIGSPKFAPVQALPFVWVPAQAPAFGTDGLPPSFSESSHSVTVVHGSCNSGSSTTIQVTFGDAEKYLDGATYKWRVPYSVIARISVDVLDETQVATPTCSPDHGTVDPTLQHFILSCATPGAVIHYKVGATLPGDIVETDPVYGATPLLALGASDGDFYIRAKAFKDCMLPSDSDNWVFTVQGSGTTTAAPTFSYPDGTQKDAGDTIVITVGASGDDLYVTTDGSDPARSGLSPVTLYGLTYTVTLGTPPETIKAMARHAGQKDSATVQATYILKFDSTFQRFRDLKVDGTVIYWVWVPVTATLVDGRIKFTEGTESSSSTSLPLVGPCST